MVKKSQFALFLGILWIKLKAFSGSKIFDLRNDQIVGGSLFFRKNLVF
jgi:hypothetical protein